MTTMLVMTTMSSLVTKKIGVDMSLREMILERVFFCLSEEELMSEFSLTENEVTELSDLDLLELYEQVCFLQA